MKQKQQTLQVVYVIGGMMTVIGAVAQLFQIAFAPYLFSFGIGLLVYFQFVLMLNAKSADVRQKRLSRVQFMTSLLLILASYFMFTSSNSWVVLVLIYSLSSFFYSFRGN